MPSMADAIRFRRSVDRLVKAASRNARAHAEKLLASFDPDMSEEAWVSLREAVIQTFLGDVNLGSDAVGALAANFYDLCTDGIANAGKGTVDGLSRITPEQAEGTVRRLAGRLFRTNAQGERLPPDKRGFLEGIESYASKRSRESANETIERCVQRSPNKEMRYQRVPTGSETCTFCAMLASQGAVYRTAATAGKANHNNCRCVATPAPKGQSVEGCPKEDWLKVWERFQEIDEMEGLTSEKKDALKGISLSLTNPRSHGVGKTDILSKATLLMHDPVKEYLSEKPRSKDTYERTVGKTLAQIGKGCGVSLAGSTGKSSNGALVGALPKPDEINLALIYGKHQKMPLTFNPEINDKMPDARFSGGYLEIKDITSLRKIPKRLAESSGKMNAVGAQRRVVALGVSGVNRDRKDILNKVQPFVDDGTFDEIMVVWTRIGDDVSIVKKK